MHQGIILKSWISKELSKTLLHQLHMHIIREVPRQLLEKLRQQQLVAQFFLTNYLIFPRIVFKKCAVKSPN